MMEATIVEVIQQLGLPVALVAGYFYTDNKKYQQTREDTLQREERYSKQIERFGDQMDKFSDTLTAIDTRLQQLEKRGE